MCGKKRKKNSGLNEAFVAIVVLPLLLVNIYAGWRILKIAEALEIPIFGTVHGAPMQLAGLLFVNGVVITLLAVIKGK